MAIQTIGVRIIMLGLEAYQRGASSMTAATLQMGGAATAVQSPMIKAATSVNTFGRSIANIGSALTLGLTTPLLIGAGLAGKAAVDYEDAFFGIGKTVDGVLEILDDGTVVMTDFGESLSTSIRQISKEIPIAAKDLANYGEIAGQLGVPKEEILSFIEIIGKLGVATNVTAEEGAADLARLGAIYSDTGKVSADVTNQWASAVVALGNNFAVTESEIFRGSKRLAGIGKVIGATEGDILGLAAGVRVAGVEIQAGSSAIQRTFIEMNKAVETGSESLGQFTEIARIGGLEAGTTFAEVFRTDATEALLMFIDGLGKAEEQGIDTFQVLDQLSLDQIRTIRTLLPMAGASDQVRAAVAKANDEFERATALNIEAEKRFGSLKSQFLLVKNEVTDLAITIGLQLMPIFLDFLQNTIVPLVKQFSELSPEIQMNILKFLGLAAAIGPLLLVLGGVIQAITTLITIGATVAGVIGGIGLSIAGLVSAIGIIAGLGAVGLVISQNWETVKSVVEDVGGAVQSSAEQIGEGAREAGESLRENFGELSENLAPIIEENLGGVFKGLEPIVEDVGATITDIFADVGPFVVENMEVVTDWFDENLPLIEETVAVVTAKIKEIWDEFAANMLEVWETNGPILIASVEFIWETIKTIISSIVNTILETITAIMQAITGDWEGAWETIKGIGESIFGATIEIIENLLNTIAGFFDTNLEGIGETWTEVWELLKTIVSTKFEAIKTTITDAIASIGEFFTGLWEDLTGSTTDGGEEVKGIFGEKLDAIKETVSNTIASIGEFFSNMWDDIITFVTEGGGVVGDIFRSIFSIIASIVRIAVNVIGSLIGLLVSVIVIIFTGLVSIIKTIWSTVAAIIVGAWEGIVALLAPILAAIGTVITTAWENISTFFTIQFENLKALFSVAWQAISLIFTTIWGAISLIITTAWENITTFLTTAFETLKTFFTVAWEAIKLIFTEVFQAISDTITEKVEAWKLKFTEFFTGITEGVTEFVETFLGKIATFIEDVAQFFRDMEEDTQSTMEELVSGVIEKVSTMVTDVVNKVSEVASDFKDAAIAWMDAIVDGIESGAGAVFQAIKDLAKRMIDKLLGALSGSPQLFTFHIGEDMMSDLQKGVDKTAVGAIGNIVSAVQGDLMAGLGALTSAPVPAAAGPQFVPVPIETTKFTVNAEYRREQTPDTVGEQLANLVALNG